MAMRSRGHIGVLAGACSIVIAAAAGTASVAQDFDWKQESGSSINALLVSHPFVESIKPLVPEFEALTGIDVNLEVLAEQAANEKLLADLSSKAGTIDVFMTSPLQNWQYATANWVADLDPFLNDPALTDGSYDVDDFYQGVLNSNRWTREPMTGIGEGALWGLPVNSETYILSYRPSVFEELGLEVPETYADLLEIADKLDDGSAEFGLITRFDKFWDLPYLTFGTMLQSYGVEMLDADGNLQVCSEASIAATDDFVQLIKTASPEGAGAFTWYEALQGFAAGQYALSLDEADLFAAVYEDPSQSEISDDVGYAPTPLGPDGERKAGAWIWSMSMNEASSSKNAAWLFLSWVTSKDVMAKTHLAGNMNPVRQSAWENPDVAAMVDSWGASPGQYREVTGIMNEVAAVRFPPHPELTRMLDRWAQAVQEVYFNGTDTKEALCAAQADIERML
ncbi:MAG: extracellular solute-binding protein [Hyphomicrobiales bacterium]|nr:extracellular solute-binding protein [Hyphomicrobiales bacterium]